MDMCEQAAVNQLDEALHSLGMVEYPKTFSPKLSSSANITVR